MTEMNNGRTNKNEPWYKNMSTIRWIFAICGILTMLFAGGCSLMVFASFLDRGTDQYGFNAPTTILVVGGLPFVTGLVIWWLAAKIGRNQDQEVS